MPIDTRFCAQPKKITFPLYPLQTEYRPFAGFFVEELETQLKNRIAKVFQRNAEECFLAATGRSLLAFFLAWLQKEKGRSLIVALPAFYCPHTCSAIAATGVTIVFIDIDHSFRMTEAGIDFALQAYADVIIWPDLFTANIVDTSVLRKNKDILIVRDVAHTFPLVDPLLSDNADRIVTLFSFGSGKVLAGIGGGGILISKREMLSRFKSTYEASLFPAPAHEKRDILCNTFRAKLRQIAPQWSVRLGLLGPLLKDHSDFLEITLHTNPVMQPLVAMSASQVAIALDHWDRMLAIQARHKELVDRQIKNIEDQLGEEAIFHLRHAPHIGVFAIRVPSDRRYAISQQLADQGIQTTWYYYPLTKTKAFSSCQAQQIPVTEQLSSEILVLPCQWTHSEKSYSHTFNLLA